MESNILCARVQNFLLLASLCKIVSSTYFPFPVASLIRKMANFVTKPTREKPKQIKIKRMKEKNSDSQISRKRKRANSETEETSSKDFHPKKLSKKHILQCISAIFHLTQEQLKAKNDLLVTEVQPIFVQVTCIKVPKVSRRQMRM